MPLVLQTRTIFEAQGYGVTENIVHQGKNSAIIMDKNGNYLSIKRTKYINIRYFL